MPRRKQIVPSCPTTAWPPVIVPKVPVPGMPVQVFAIDPSGWRTWLVLAVGRKWVTLFSASSLETWKVRLKTHPTQVHWEGLRRKCYEANKKKILEVLDTNTAQYTALCMQFSEVNANLARKLVRGWKKGNLCTS